MNHSRFLLSVLITILVWSSSYTQDQTEEVPLIIIINELQRKHGVQFNYAPKIIEDIVVLRPGENLTLQESIEHLAKITGLRFNSVGNDIITILKPTALLCAFLRDKDSGDPVVYATVSMGNLSTTTDINGYFELKRDTEEALVRINHIGYKALERELAFFNTDKCGEVYMIPDQQQLAEVVLYDYLTKGIDKLDDGSYTIDFNQFTILPGLIENDVLQSVQAFPGIQSINETVSNINIRGGSHDQNLILWDGIKMYQSGHFFGLISMYHPQITQRLTLRKNGSPTDFTDGVSGTIEMETEKELNRDLKGNIAINFIDVSGFADIPLGKKSSIQLAARKSIRDFWETPTYSEYFDRIAQDTELANNTDQVENTDNEFDFFDTSFRWLYTPTDKDEIQLNFISANNKLLFNENAELDNEQVTRQSNLEQNSIAGGFRYRRAWNEDFSTNLQVYNTDYKLRARNANILQDQRFIQENKVSETGILLSTDYLLKNNLHWINGYQFIETKVSNLDDVDDPVFRRLIAEVLRIHALFTSIDLHSMDRRTKLNLGLRYNYLEKFSKSIIEPRLSLDYRILDGLHLELLGEFKHQNTSQIINFQNDFLGIEKRRWQLSNNADIPVIESKQLSAGFSYNRKGWLFNAVGYIKEVDGITSQSQGFQNQFEFTRTDGSYESIGVDFLLRKQLNDVNTWLSYSYLKSTYDFEDLSTESFPSNFDIPHALGAGITYAPGALRLSAGLNWRSGKPVTLPNDVQPVIDDQIDYQPVNSDRLEDYFRVDVSGIYDFPIGPDVKGQLGVSVWNLLNRENPINTYFTIDEFSQTEQLTETSLGITPNAVLRIYF